jgi:hypothetical protein
MVRTSATAVVFFSLACPCPYPVMLEIIEFRPFFGKNALLRYKIKARGSRETF